MQIAEWVIKKILAIDPVKRRLYAARQLIASLIGWPVSHVLVVVADESGMFTHIVMAISWYAIIATSVDIVFTTDVRAETKG